MANGPRYGGASVRHVLSDKQNIAAPTGARKEPAKICVVTPALKSKRTRKKAPATAHTPSRTAKRAPSKPQARSGRSVRAEPSLPEETLNTAPEGEFAVFRDTAIPSFQLRILEGATAEEDAKLDDPWVSAPSHGVSLSPVSGDIPRAPGDDVGLTVADASHSIDQTFGDDFPGLSDVFGVVDAIREQFEGLQSNLDAEVRLTRRLLASKDASTFLDDVSHSMAALESCLVIAQDKIEGFVQFAALARKEVGRVVVDSPPEVKARNAGPESGAGGPSPEFRVPRRFQVPLDGDSESLSVPILRKELEGKQLERARFCRLLLLEISQQYQRLLEVEAGEPPRMSTSGGTEAEVSVSDKSEVVLPFHREDLLAEQEFVERELCSAQHELQDARNTELRLRKELGNLLSDCQGAGTS